MIHDRCQECKEAVSQYQCPRCSRRTCSLACCQSHKKRTGCNGKRDRSTYLRLEEMNDATMNSDYFFLENVMQTVDGGRRLLKEVGAITAGGSQCLLHTADTLKACNHIDGDDDQDHDDNQHRRYRKRPKPYEEQLPSKWRRLVQIAADRNVTLLLMPPGMERHKSNTTHFHAKSNALIWKLDFVVHLDSTTTPKIFCRNKISEEKSIGQEWERIEHNISTDQDLHFLVKMIPRPSNKAEYVEVNKGATLKEALKGMTVIEYPTIHVVTPAQLHKFPRLIQEVE